jgi:hypothetical protein
MSVAIDEPEAPVAAKAPVQTAWDKCKNEVAALSACALTAGVSYAAVGIMQIGFHAPLQAVAVVGAFALAATALTKYIATKLGKKISSFKTPSNDEEGNANIGMISVGGTLGAAALIVSPAIICMNKLDNPALDTTYAFIITGCTMCVSILGLIGIRQKLEAIKLPTSQNG